jgi:hypothetical protein
MKLTLLRQPSTLRSTPGTLLIDGIFECYTLEDVVRPVKIQNQTAIPAGEYEVIINSSARFKRLMPLLLNVPGYDGVRIHPGNTDADTDGCILVGDVPSHDFLGSSRPAFGRLFPKLKVAFDAKQSISLTITNC